MPGIVGIISRRPAEQCRRLVASMLASMNHESFSESGSYSVNEMNIHAGWIAHKDSFSAGQVFFNDRRDIALLFAGECFIDPQTIAQLKRRGHPIEKEIGAWLIALYEEEPKRFWDRLNGLFSGLLIDTRQRKAFLFNDRYGLERVYWHETDEAVYFASEAKALLRILPELRAFDEQGVAQFLAYGCTLNWGTIFRGIHLLPGGSVWSFEKGRCYKGRYFTPQVWEAQPALTPEAFELEFQKTFQRIINRYFDSRSRIGISLTGGLDTRMIMACRPQMSNEPVCYTFSGPSGQTFDDRLANKIAQKCGLQHRLLRLGENFFPDFATHVDQTVYVTDGCFGVLGAHEIYFNDKARELAPVRLTGNFGSEILREVSTFKPICLSRDLFSPEFIRFSDASSGDTFQDSTPVGFAAFREIPWKLFGGMAAAKSQVSFRTPYLDNELVALVYRAPASLRRSPLPASRLVRSNNVILSRIPTDRGLTGGNIGLMCFVSRLLGEITFKIDYYNTEGLPKRLTPFDSILRRASRRLGILGLHKYLPYRHWFRKELANYIRDTISEAQAKPMSFWNPRFLKTLAADHISGRRNYVREINAILTLWSVERLLFHWQDCRESHVRGNDGATA